MSTERAGRVSADESTLKTLGQLWPFIWPKNRSDLKWRVGLALIALVVAKIITVLSPYFYKWATDALTGDLSPQDWIPALLVVPMMLVLAYNVTRVLAVGFNQIRDALFARVGQHAVRQLAQITFRHMHALSLRFHLAGARAD